MGINLKRIYDMANFNTRSTGVKGVVWVSSQSPRHKPRVKWEPYAGVSISLSIETGEVLAPRMLNVSGKSLDDVREWISINKSTLLEYWYQEIDTSELVSKLKRIK